MALFAVLPASVALGSRDPSAPVIAYLATLVAMFAVSSAYHSKGMSASLRSWLRRVDHAMIYVYIAGCCAPYCMGALGGGLLAWVLLGLTSAGAIIGALWKLTAFEAKRPWAAGLYLVLGWLGVFTLPSAFSRLGASALALVCISGMLYTCGAIVLASRWPDPAPEVFGYHEVWHAAVVAASGCYFAAVWFMPSLH
jgi:hemolysin III